jgi:DNA-binding transcriptional MerR regulator
MQIRHSFNQLCYRQRNFPNSLHMADQTSTRMFIGQFVALTGHSVHTVRWYETQGLLPRVPRDAAKRRIYSKRHVSCIALMDRLRRSGMSIAQLREYTRLAQQGGATLMPTRRMLQEHKSIVEAKILEWQQALALIDEKIDFYSQWIETGHRPDKRHHDK